MVVFKDISDDGMGYIDMFFKLVDKNIVIVGDYGIYVMDVINNINMDNNEVLLEVIMVVGGGIVNVM